MKFRRAPLRYACSFLLICGGAAGILFSPMVGVVGGRETRSFTLSESRDYSWGTAISSSELEVASVRNYRGLLFMNIFIAGSLGTMFGGVRWFNALRLRPVKCKS